MRSVHSPLPFGTPPASRLARPLRRPAWRGFGTLLALAALLLAPLSAQAWWNEAWTQRSVVTIDTTAAGSNVTEPLTQVPLALRLHSGNFDFLSAKPDGSDLRVVAGDDKTPLAFRIERWDAANELAVVWVLLPALAPNVAEGVKLHVYAGNANAPAPAASAPAAGGIPGLDAAVRAALHFSEPAAADALKPADGSTPAVLPAGLLGGALRLSGQPLVYAADPRLEAAAGGALSVSVWVQPAAVDRGTVWQFGPLSLAVDGGRFAARVGGATLAGGTATAAKWTHVMLSVGGGRAALVVDGAQVAQAELALPAVAGELRLGDGLSGALDEWQLANVARPLAWAAFAAATQGIGSKGVAARPEAAGEAEAASPGYMGILVKNLTVDAWVVIVICGLMLVVACWVMWAKTVLVQRADRANRSFLLRFRDARDDLLAIDGAPHADSSLYRLYAAGVRELAKRDIGGAGAAARPGAVLSGASLDAVKASIDADLVRENHRLNSQMVLLTIAISGGPFLGLLGTVIGVMITFAAIAAAGDVNVNAIAPGIAAALLATVAGLGVAIPALFGYNYLATRIKNISADMQIFVDEFVTRVAERHGAR